MEKPTFPYGRRELWNRLEPLADSIQRRCGRRIRFCLKATGKSFRYVLRLHGPEILLRLEPGGVTQKP